jgi:hypothetical protein
MNFIAIIGIVDKLSKSTTNNNHTLRIKVEKSAFNHTDEEWYDIVNVNLDKEIFQTEMNSISKGCIIGVKGRAQ